MFRETRVCGGVPHTRSGAFPIRFPAMPRLDRSGHFPERLVRQGLVSLAVAARMVHRRAHPQPYSTAAPALSERELDALAHVISTLAPIYTVNYRSARFHQLDEASFEGGMFRGGARGIAFSDSRAPIRHLAGRGG